MSVSLTDVGGGHKVLSFLQHLRHVKQDCHGDRSLYVMGDASERLENSQLLMLSSLRTLNDDGGDDLETGEDDASHRSLCKYSLDMAFRFQTVRLVTVSLTIGRNRFMLLWVASHFGRA
jgi:hypothetical protein